MGADGPAIVKRYTRLCNDAALHFTYCDEMAPYIAPSRYGILSKQSVGAKQPRIVYDSTTMMAAEICAHFVAGNTINPAQLWGSMSMRHPRKRAQDEINEWLEESRDRQLKEYSRSLFYAEAVESKIDWVGFGTGYLFREEIPMPVNRVVRGFRGLRFEAKKTGRFVCADGVDGLIDTSYDEVVMSARMMVDRWGKNAVSEKVKHAIDNDKPDDLFTIIHGVYPRSLADQEYQSGAKKMPWASCWVEKSEKKLIHESGYKQFPGSIYRYTRTPGETFGRGRGHLAFPDTWTLNTAKRMGLEDWSLKMQPPVLASHDSVIGTLKLIPAGVTSINTRGRSIADVLTSYQTGSHPEVSQIKEEELRKSIRQIFFVDQILMLMEVNKSEMTAYEFAKKMDLLFKIMGPVYGRVEHEFLRQEWDGTFTTLYDAGVFSPPPESIFETDGLIETTFQNPIARSQRSGDVDAITKTIQELTPMAAFAPQVFDRIDPQKSAQLIMDINGYPARGTRNDDEMDALAAARHEQNVADQQMEQVGQVADAGGKIAPLLRELKRGQAA
jgi:hypothetical protein